MKYLIGIEGGATKTNCAAADLNGNIIAELKGKPSNFLISGVEQTVTNLFNLIEMCLHRINAGFDELQQIVIGTAGAGRIEHAGVLETEFIKFAAHKKIKLSGVKVVSDAMITLEGAFPSKPGCILICGTGSILYGRDQNNVIHRVGGYGRLIGDEGSGYSIGRKGINAAAKDLDRRSAPTILTKILNNDFSVNSADELIKIVYSKNFNISSFAKSVIAAAAAGDLISVKILEEETEEVILHLKSLLKKLSIPEVQVVFAGSLIDNENFYSNLIKERISKTLPGVRIVKPAYSPVAGAILIARTLVSSAGQI